MCGRLTGPRERRRRSARALPRQRQRLHSFVEEPDDAPEGMLGWREVTMVPADENWEVIDALART